MNQCRRCDTCETLAVWRELDEAINRVVDGVTVGELARRQTEREGIMNYSI